MHQNKNQNNHTHHEPVLLAEVLQYLDPHEKDSYLDLTAGYGGHANEVLKLTGNYRDSVLVDRDQNAIDELTQQFGPTGISLTHTDFLSASIDLVNQKQSYDLILADLGVSSPHLNEVSRGFAIAGSGPLDMRMDNRQTLTAAKVVNTYKEAALAEILIRYGEEPKARQIARMIVENRPFTTTDQLATVVAKAWPGHSRVHPATRTFQAFRIAVNDELNLLTEALPLWLQLLKPGGRIAIISFHSLEDRLVKQAFQEVAGERYDADFRILTKRPITASPNELVHNPRARSAKLRVAVKK